MFLFHFGCSYNVLMLLVASNKKVKDLISQRWIKEYIPYLNRSTVRGFAAVNYS